MYTDLASLDGVLTVFEHYDATLVSGPVHTAGTWDYAPSYSSGTGHVYLYDVIPQVLPY
jgi:hypothetical protein